MGNRGEFASAGGAYHPSHFVRQSRQLLADVQIGVDEAANGVFLPRFLTSPNPTGAAVHSTLHTNVYYEAVYNALAPHAGNRQALLQALGSIRQRLLAGQFP